MFIVPQLSYQFFSDLQCVKIKPDDYLFQHHEFLPLFFHTDIMKIIEVILIIISYSLGIASLIVQFICYLKKMEFFINILFSISFLLLVSALSLNELNLIFAANGSPVIEGFIVISMLFLALTTPLSIHKERIVKSEHKANIVIYIASAVLFLFLIASYILDIRAIAEIIIRNFMFASIGYSMIIMLTKKPVMLIKHRAKIDKITSIVFLSILPFFAFIDLLYDRIPSIHTYIPEGGYMLYLFFIYLASTNLMDGFKRITLFTPENSINQHVLARYEITPRESEVLMYIIKGKSYSEIADLLYISMPTVKTHISRAYKKMNINNKIELINLLNVNNMVSN